MGSCPDLVGAHILPNSFVNDPSSSNEHPTLWPFYTFFLGPPLRDQLWCYLQDGGGHSTYNGLLLATGVHNLFGTSLITLIPLSDPPTTNTLTFRFT